MLTFGEVKKEVESGAIDTVLVCQPNDGVIAHMGELSAETLKLRGVRGYVVDGGCRDVNAESTRNQNLTAESATKWIIC